jgi:hypothetical protein
MTKKLINFEEVKKTLDMLANHDGFFFSRVLEGAGHKFLYDNSDGRYRVYDPRTHKYYESQRRTYLSREFKNPLRRFFKVSNEDISVPYKGRRK